MNANGQAVFNDASFLISFGPLGGGKTVDQIAAFPRALVCSLTRELKSVISVLGIPCTPPGPLVVEVSTLYDVERHCDDLLKSRREKNAMALSVVGFVIDDISMIAGQTEKALREGVKVGNEHKKPKGWDLWTEQRSESMQIAVRVSEKLKQAGIHLAVNGHQRMARTNAAGKVIRGGIDLPTDLAEAFPAAAELCAKIEPEEQRLWQKTAFNVGAMNPSWAMKNRLVQGLPERIPHNTGELMRAAGYVLPRPVGLEAHEEMVEKLANYILAGAGVNALTLELLRQALPGPTIELSKIVPNPLHVQWIVRDAVDRAWFRRAKQRSLFTEVGVT